MFRVNILGSKVWGLRVNYLGFKYRTHSELTFPGPRGGIVARQFGHCTPFESACHLLAVTAAAGGIAARGVSGLRGLGSMV